MDEQKNNTQGVASGQVNNVQAPVWLKEQVDYSKEVASENLDMNPPRGYIVDPNVSSSVLVESENESNPVKLVEGFPAGYGPNANVSRVEKPKKPSFKERFSHSIGKMTKKQKKNTIIISSAVLGGGVILFLVLFLLGAFKTDYSGAYAVSKELRAEVQALRSNNSCEKVVTYVSTASVQMATYQEYITACKALVQGVLEATIEKMGNTPAVLKDDELNRKFEGFKSSYKTAKSGNEKVEKILDIYTVWHEWIIAEYNGDNAHSTWDWTTGDIDVATLILKNSGEERFVSYGEKWAELRKTAASTYYSFFHADLGSMTLDEARGKMTEAQNVFNEWKGKNQPDMSTEFPLVLADTARLYSRFEDMYGYVRTKYQENYNRKVGGCKELLSSVVCE